MSAAAVRKGKEEVLRRWESGESWGKGRRSGGGGCFLAARLVVMGTKNFTVRVLSMDVDATAVAAAAAAAPADWVLVDHQLEVDGTIFAFWVVDDILGPGCAFDRDENALCNMKTKLYKFF